MKYARYAEERGGNNVGAILRIALPIELTSSVRQVFGSERELIWCSRRRAVARRNLLQLPAHLRHFEEEDILIGEICGVCDHQIERLADMSELQAMRLQNGSRASQLVFQSVRAIQQLQEQCQGFVWVSNVTTPNEAVTLPAPTIAT